MSCIMTLEFKSAILKQSTINYFSARTLTQLHSFLCTSFSENFPGTSWCNQFEDASKFLHGYICNQLKVKYFFKYDVIYYLIRYNKSSKSCFHCPCFQSESDSPSFA